MTTIKHAMMGVETYSPKAELVPLDKVVVKTNSRKVKKGAGAKLSYSDLRRLVKTNQPPQSWYDETNS